jgi:hypothetical protein
MIDNNSIRVFNETSRNYDYWQWTSMLTVNENSCSKAYRSLERNNLLWSDLSSFTISSSIVYDYCWQWYLVKSKPVLIDGKDFISSMTSFLINVESKKNINRRLENFDKRLVDVIDAIVHLSKTVLDIPRIILIFILLLWRIKRQTSAK